MSADRTVAVLGTGLMGAPMARRLLQAGFSVVAWNRTRAKAEALAADGARVADSAADAAREADVIIAMLENGPVVGEVLFEQGAGDAPLPGSLIIDMSSIPPAMAREHAIRLARRGVRHLDAPVSGGTVGAEQGSLAIMVGGAPENFAEAEPLFKCMGRATLVGPSGSGQLAKLANQAIVAVTIGAVAEALLLAQKGGADPAAVRQAIRGGFAESRILELHGQRMVERDFAVRGKVTTHIKDLDAALAAAKAAGVDLPFAREARRRLADLTERMGGGGLDHSALFLQLEDSAGGPSSS